MAEYAPEYTRKEKWLHVAKALAWGVPAIALAKFWFEPWFASYAAIAQCKDYGYFTGTHVVAYFIFVVLPAGSAIFVAATRGRRLRDVIALGQFPLPWETVFNKTKYIYGIRARAPAYLSIVLILLLFGLGARGVFWANAYIDDQNAKGVECDKS